MMIKEYKISFVSYYVSQLYIVVLREWLVLPACWTSDSPELLKKFRALLAEAYNYVPEDRGLAAFRSDENVNGRFSCYRRLKFILKIYGYGMTWVLPETTTSLSGVNFTGIVYCNYTIESRKYDWGRYWRGEAVVGESHMLRAYVHFLLVNLYGEPYTLICDRRPLRLFLLNWIVIGGCA